MNRLVTFNTIHPVRKYISLTILAASCSIFLFPPIFGAAESDEPADERTEEMRHRLRVNACTALRNWNNPLCNPSTRDHLIPTDIDYTLDVPPTQFVEAVLPPCVAFTEKYNIPHREEYPLSFLISIYHTFFPSAETANLPADILIYADDCNDAIKQLIPTDPKIPNPFGILVHREIGFNLINAFIQEDRWTAIKASLFSAITAGIATSRFRTYKIEVNDISFFYSLEYILLRVLSQLGKLDTSGTAPHLRFILKRCTDYAPSIIYAPYLYLKAIEALEPEEKTTQVEKLRTNVLRPLISFFEAAAKERATLSDDELFDLCRHTTLPHITSLERKINRCFFRMVKEARDAEERTDQQRREARAPQELQICAPGGTLDRVEEKTPTPHEERVDSES